MNVTETAEKILKRVYEIQVNQEHLPEEKDDIPPLMGELANLNDDYNIVDASIKMLKDMGLIKVAMMFGRLKGKSGSIQKFLGGYLTPKGIMAVEGKISLSSLVEV